jgi:hypothetical protein
VIAELGCFPAGIKLHLEKEGCLLCIRAFFPRKPAWLYRSLHRFWKIISEHPVYSDLALALSLSIFDIQKFSQ